MAVILEEDSKGGLSFKWMKCYLTYQNITETSKKYSQVHFIFAKLMKISSGDEYKAIFIDLKNQDTYLRKAEGFKF